MRPGHEQSTTHTIVRGNPNTAPLVSPFMPKHTKSTLPRPKPQLAQSRPAVNGKRYGTRNLILDTLKAPSASKGLSTSEIIKEVRKAKGSPIPEQSFRQALRTLVRYKVVQSKRVGREKTYRISNQAPGNTPPSPPVGPKAPSVPRVIVQDVLAIQPTGPL